MKSTSATLLVLATASTALAHATFQDPWINSQDTESQFVRMPPSNSPVQDVTSNAMRCNVGGDKGLPGLGKVTAGQTVTVEILQQPGDRDCATEAIDGAHYGPVMVYMSKVDDASTADGSAPSFKIAQERYAAENKTWGTQTLNANCGKFTATVPASLAPGGYLLRAEAIALRSASQPGGAQIYMSCFQLDIAGDGTASPDGVPFPDAYGADDPGVLINIYGDFGEYVAPGPEVWTG